MSDAVIVALITAAAGKIITVIEVNSDDKVVSLGYVASVPKAAG